MADSGDVVPHEQGPVSNSIEPSMHGCKTPFRDMQVFPEAVHAPYANSSSDGVTKADAAPGACQGRKECGYWTHLASPDKVPAENQQGLVRNRKSDHARREERENRHISVGSVCGDPLKDGVHCSTITALRDSARF